MNLQNYLNLYKDLRYFIVPGLGNSGKEHWQTYIENKIPSARRIVQDNWDAPAANAWIKKINEKLKNEDLSRVVLIGQSLGCLAIAKWAIANHKTIKAALLVAPADIEKSSPIIDLNSFLPLPLHRLSFKTLVVASTNDEWLSIKRAEQFARIWGSDIENIGEAGHINASSGYGKWENIFSLLHQLLNSTK